MTPASSDRSLRSDLVGENVTDTSSLTGGRSWARYPLFRKGMPETEIELVAESVVAKLSAWCAVPSAANSAPLSILIGAHPQS